MMGLMTLSRLIMYFCGDYDSWDPRALMMGMGGGMMGGDGRRHGRRWAAAWAAMGGGMRSVPTAGPPIADLRPRQTRNLPTCVVSLSTPDAEGRGRLPAEGEEVRIVGDIAQINDDPAVQKALRKLAATRVPTTVSQLVMWRVSGGLDWETIAQLSAGWANR